MASASVAFDEVPVNDITPEEVAGPPRQEFAPVTRQERIHSLDVLRGFALMGILLMNITSFALPGWAYDVPLGTLLPVFSGPHAKANTAAWMLRWIFAEGKMRALFSMLFGAGAVLLTDRAERRGGGDKVADIFLRRNMWLVLLGALHGYFIWNGDILFWYGLNGLLFLYPMRKLQPNTLIKAAGWVLLVWTLVGGVGRFTGTYFNQKKGIDAIRKVISYGDVFLRNEREYSAYSFDHGNPALLSRLFADAEAECSRLLTAGLALPAYDQCINASHLFNLLDASGAIAVTERAAFIGRVRTLAKGCCDAWLAGDAPVVTG